MKTLFATPPSPVGKSLTLSFAVFCALGLALAPQVVYAQHGATGHTGGGGHFAGAPHAAAPPPVAMPQHYIPVQQPRPVVVPPANRAPGPVFHPPLVNSFAPGSRPGSLGVPGSYFGSAQTPHVTIGYPPDPLQHGFTVGPPQHLPGTTVSGTVRFEGQGRDIWESTLHGSALEPQPGPHTPAGWSTVPGRGWRPSPPPRGRPLQGPPHGRGFGFGFLGAPFFGYPYFPGFGLGLGYGWFDTCGPYWNWGFGCDVPGYYSNGYGYGSDNGYFLNAEPFEPSTWPNDQSLQQPEENPPITFPDQAPTPEQEQNNLRADQLETVIFLNDGGVYLVTDYWIANGQLHFASGESEVAIPLDQIDIQKTVDVNASRGLTVTLRPGPAADNSPASPNVAPAAPAAPPVPSAPPAPPVPPAPNAPRTPQP